MVAAMQRQPMVIVAGAVGAAALSGEDRRALLGSIDTREALSKVAKIQADWDIASTTHWDVKPLQLTLLSTAQAPWVAAVRNQVEAGNILTSPQVTVQLMREVLECESTLSEPLSGDDLVHLLISIASEQQILDWFESDVPSAAEFAALDAKFKVMAPDDLNALNHDMLSSLGASALFNAPRKIESYKADTYDFWYSEWSERAADELGGTPAETFEAATGINFDDFLRAGLVVSDAALSGRTVIGIKELSDHSAVRDFMVKNVALDLARYRAELAADRERGDVKLQRFTFTRFPLLALDDGTLLILRAQWAIERFFGDPALFDVIAAFNARRDKAMARRFDEGIKYQFEDVVGRVVARIAARSGRVEAVVAEPELEAEWTEKKGCKPSVCDWVLRCGPVAVLIEATHHPWKASLAQGLGDGEEYSADADKVLTKRKFEQLASAMRLVRRLGWSGKPQPSAVFIPLVVVPNSGAPSSMLSELDYGTRAMPVFAEFQGSVARPTVLQLRDLQLLEGLREYPQMEAISLLYQWRKGSLPMTLQEFLEMAGLPRPIPKRIFKDATRLDERLAR